MTEAKELDPVALEAAVDYVLRYGGRCRDCADEAGICPHSGLACDPDDAAKVIRYVLRNGDVSEFRLRALQSIKTSETPE